MKATLLTLLGLISTTSQASPLLCGSEDGVFELRDNAEFASTRGCPTLFEMDTIRHTDQSLQQLNTKPIIFSHHDGDTELTDILFKTTYFVPSKKAIESTNKTYNGASPSKTEIWLSWYSARYESSIRINCIPYQSGARPILQVRLAGHGKSSKKSLECFYQRSNSQTY